MTAEKVFFSVTDVTAVPDFNFFFGTKSPEMLAYVCVIRHIHMCLSTLYECERMWVIVFVSVCV